MTERHIAEQEREIYGEKLAALNAVDGLLSVCNAILTRWDLEIQERGPDTQFPGRALRNDLAASVDDVGNKVQVHRQNWHIADS